MSIRYRYESSMRISSIGFLAGFGFGTFYESGQQLATFCGSPPYAAPEMFLGHAYNGQAADVWVSFALLSV